jgi:hypothetical protein
LSHSLRFPYQNPVYTSHLPVSSTCPTHLIWSPKHYYMSSTDHQAPHYVVFPTYFLFHSHLHQISPSAPPLTHPQPKFLPHVNDQAISYHNRLTPFWTSRVLSRRCRHVTPQPLVEVIFREERLTLTTCLSVCLSVCM